MNNYKNVFELIDISSSESDEESIGERASTPLPRSIQPNFRVVVDVYNSSAEAVADEEECFDISADSLEADCKRMRLSSSLESLESGELDRTAPNPEYSTMRESPESPDIQSENEEEGFVVESHRLPSPQSITSCMINEYLEQVHREEENISFFETPPGTPKRITVPQSPLNDLGTVRSSSATSKRRMELPPLTLAPRLPGRGVFPRGVALSQPAPGLGCSCKRIGIGRGHGCSLRFPRWYFNY